MPTRHLSIALAAAEEVRDELAALRVELGLPAMFPPEVMAEAEAAVGRDLATAAGDKRADRRDLPLVTIDPPGSMDLDQAVFIKATEKGFLVNYAIADLAAFVEPGGALDRETNRRGCTIYGPDARTPLHPKILSEGAASLLPGEDRPAALWSIELDHDGAIGTAWVERATVRSRARLTYGEVQAALDDGTADESLKLLRAVGMLRQSQEAERGGVSLDVPEQEVTLQPDGTFALKIRSTLPVEGWNAQISLMTGIVAAEIMREAGVGILRTLPPADPRDLARLHRIAAALEIPWPDSMPYSGLIAKLDSRRPHHAAFLNEATTLFRGAGYLPFGVPAGEPKRPDDPAAGTLVELPAGGAPHSAIAAEYAHVTAPLRRLVDRYGTEVCLAQCSHGRIPEWVRAGLAGLPTAMSGAAATAGVFERAAVEIVEAALLQHRIGQRFDGVVVEVSERKDGAPPTRGEVLLRDPAVRARVDLAEPGASGTAGLPLGERVRVTLAVADVKQREVRFTL